MFSGRLYLQATQAVYRPDGVCNCFGLEALGQVLRQLPVGHRLVVAKQIA